ncbi:hypothetical protein FOZ62_025697, partial [Perkinsus olseni]
VLPGGTVVISLPLPLAQLDALRNDHKEQEQERLKLRLTDTERAVIVKRLERTKSLEWRRSSEGTTITIEEHLDDPSKVYQRRRGHRSVHGWWMSILLYQVLSRNASFEEAARSFWSEYVAPTGLFELAAFTRCPYLCTGPVKSILATGSDPESFCRVLVNSVAAEGLAQPGWDGEKGPTYRGPPRGAGKPLPGPVDWRGTQTAYAVNGPMGAPEVRAFGKSSNTIGQYVPCNSHEVGSCQATLTRWRPAGADGDRVSAFYRNTGARRHRMEPAFRDTKAFGKPLPPHPWIHPSRYRERVASTPRSIRAASRSSRCGSSSSRSSRSKSSTLYTVKSRSTHKSTNTNSSAPLSCSSSEAYARASWAFDKLPMYRTHNGEYGQPFYDGSRGRRLIHHEERRAPAGYVYLGYPDDKFREFYPYH